MASENNRATMALAVAVTLVVAGLGGYFVGSSTQRPGADAEVIATVNGDRITRAEVHDKLMAYYGAGVVDDMILTRLVDQEAAKAGVTVTDAEVEEKFAATKAAYGGDLNFAWALSQYGLTEAQFRDMLRRDMVATRVLRQQLQPDDATLRAYFDEMQSSDETRKIKVRHILVETEEKANEIRAQLNAGADFAELAKAESKDTASAAQGGDLGLIGKGDTVAEFEAAAFALGDGEISAPVQSQYGWHVIQAYHLDFEREKEAIREQYLNEKVSERLGTWYSELREKAQITNSLAG
ncbi:MAG: peptidylprolyl isomerase [Bacillota bacterium]